MSIILLSCRSRFSARRSDARVHFITTRMALQQVQCILVPMPSSWFLDRGLHLCNRVSSHFLVSLCQGRGAARNFFTASSDSLFHPPLSLVFFFQSSSSPAFLTTILTQSSHLSLGLPRLLLSCSRNSAALFASPPPRKSTVAYFMRIHQPFTDIRCGLVVLSCQHRPWIY